MAPFILNRGAHGGGWLISRAGRFIRGRERRYSVGGCLAPEKNLFEVPDRPLAKSLYFFIA